MSDTNRQATFRGYGRSLPMALLRARDTVMNRFRPILRSHDVTEQQFRILRALTTAKELRAVDVSKMTLLSPPSLSRTIKGLEGRKLITRRIEKEDQRAFMLSITKKGAALVALIGQQSEAEYLDIEGRIGSKKMDQLHRLLSEVEEKI
ncbi:MAG: homoprotocatechuate degradation operon regulator HpaR [Alphaproteobacteria bacterium]|jgi:homoprotocatechuate degradation regulator HpaR|nr:homoprotocatechuate degradation operon regulator HpaR [Alphaproteobacteria bacterium]MBT4086213.1 homoprotocatechuate degradation operon regulator HpaR [Alphaproteobacteria bacterium]MBT4543830.1 homoprotocatechuate degradation operon regulator HpaR [Alphaproteobacteria bacterium]MBT7744810.1 homoprotocatechuate degradation operon regulator HpaR [Alphaproteobacteria bacterium]